MKPVRTMQRYIQKLQANKYIEQEKQKINIETNYLHFESFYDQLCEKQGHAFYC